MSGARRIRVTVATTFASAALTACGARTTLPAAGEGGGAGGDPAPEAASASSTSVAGPTGAGGGDDCEGGSSVAVREGLAARLEAHGDDLYFTQAYLPPNPGQLYRVQPGVAEAETVIAGIEGPGDIAVFDDRLYLSTDQGLFAIDLDDLPTVDLEVLFASGEMEGSPLHAEFLEVDATGVYGLTPGSGIVSGSIWYLAPGAASPTILVDTLGDPGGFALVGDRIVFSASLVPGSSEVNVIASMPRSGGAVTVLAAGLPSLAAVFELQGDIAFVADADAFGNPAGIYTMPLDASTPPALLFGAPDDALPITARASGSEVVMTTFSGSVGTIYAASLDDPELRLLDQRDEFFVEPAFASHRIAWTMQSISITPEGNEDPRIADVRWVCR